MQTRSLVIHLNIIPLPRRLAIGGSGWVRFGIAETTTIPRRDHRALDVGVDRQAASTVGHSGKCGPRAEDGAALNPTSLPSAGCAGCQGEVRKF